MGLRQLSILAAAVVVGVASTGFAQSRPTTDEAATGAGRPQVVTPFWGDEASPSVVYNASTAPAPGERLLTQTVLAVPHAKADAVVARWTYRRLDRQLNLGADNLRRDFRDSEEYNRANDEFQSAYAALESARANAVRGLTQTPEYQAATQLRRNVSEQIADEHDQKQPDIDRILALASLKLDYVTPVRSAESDVINNDPAVRDAKQRLLAAARELARLEKDFSRDVRDSIELADLRRSREDARIAMLASSAYLEEMRLARAIALNYAYLGQGVVPTRNEYGYNYGFGYGYGYGGYYGGGYSSGFARRGGGGYRGPLGVTGNSPFGAGRNALVGPGPSSRNQGGNNNATPGGVFGTGDIPGPFGR